MSQAGTKTITVLLVDDHDILRDGLAVVMSEFSDIKVVGTAASGWDAIDQCAALQPDVVLMDILMPEMDGIATTRIIRERHPTTRVVVLTSFEEEHLITSAKEAGASGYLLKNVSIDELANAVRDAYLGNPGTFPR